MEIKRQELALQAKEQEGRQQQFDMMNKQTRDIQQLQQQQMQQFMQMNANIMQQHQQQTLALMELMIKIGWEVMLVNLCKRSFKCTKSSHFY